MKYLSDFEIFCAEFLKIMTKDSGMRPLVLNKYQKFFWETIKQKKNNNKPIRIITLKPRQIGMSTAVEAYNYWEISTNKYRKALVIAHDLDSTNNLFGMAKRFYDFSPDLIKPMRRYSNAKELVFSNPNQESDIKGLLSSLSIETAGKLTAGRSGTIQHLHISEFAFWPDAATVVSGLFQSVPYKPESSIIIESTANGVSGLGEEFYNRWLAAERGDSDFTPLFFPFFWNEEYTIPIGKDFKLDNYEVELLKRHVRDGLTKEHLNWRRYKIKNEMGSALIDPVDQFRQEYPCTPEEAFITSGRPLFNIEKIKTDIEKAKSYTHRRGEINGNGEFIESERGRYTIFLDNTNSGISAIGADVAEGLETGDFSAMFGLNRDLEQTFSFCCHIAPDIFGQELCRVGKYYGKALLAPEINNHGHATLAKIKSLNYTNVYNREVKEELSDKYVKKIGWQTNRKTKMLMLDEFVAAYRDNQIKIKDTSLLKEMATLVIESDGDVKLNGKDRVVAACIALQAIKQTTEGNFQAFVPFKDKNKPKTLEEKLKYYERRKHNESYFD